ncbi:MAG TPA: bifunctional DNA primase/polymerase [Flavisolibacter sp.]|nr:bifunctional DNA primase/polymerase [Flavisolibacter sp.]
MDFSAVNQIEGLQFIPVDKTKKPIPANWQKTAKQYDLSNVEGVGLVCGTLSGNVQAIDFDLKYDITGKLYEHFKRLVNENFPDLLKRMVVQKTKNGGFHWIFRCDTVEGNLKLASRFTSETEKQATYKATYDLEIDKHGDKEKAELIASKAAKNDKVRVLIETRGEGGQIVCWPTDGYEFIYQDVTTIQTISIEEKEFLFNIARQFHTAIEEFKPIYKEKKQLKGLTTFEDYNDRADVVKLLEDNGWSKIKTKGQKVLLKRPGQTAAATSGNYDYERKWFTVFTTSTEFEPQKAYLPYAVYAILECGGDYKEAAKKLYDLGYGERLEAQKEINQKTPSKVNPYDDDFSFVSDEKEYKEYLTKARAGTLPQGLTTGSKEMDRFFVFKEATFVIINGLDNVGKTAVIMFLALISACYHNWNWIMFCAENSTGFCIRRLMEFYWNKPLKKMNDLEYKEAYNFVTNHFTFINTDDDLFNYKDILNMVKKLLKKKKYHSVLIDPYNALKIEFTASSRLNTHEYHYEALSEMQQFKKKNKICIYLNTHAVTEAGRMTNKDGNIPAPRKSHVEGGGKVANKADDFLTIHRHIQDPENWMKTELHVRKIKETESGGQHTPEKNPIRLVMMKGGCGFTVDGEGLFSNPIEQWHQRNKQGQIFPDFNPITSPDEDPF